MGHPLFRCGRKTVPSRGQGRHGSWRIRVLAGRAVWSSVIGLPDTELMLRDVSAPKLQRLGDIVDEMMACRR